MDRFLLNRELHWSVLRLDESNGEWYLHDNKQVMCIDDHEQYIEEFVVELEANRAIPVR